MTRRSAVVASALTAAIIAVIPTASTAAAAPRGGFPAEPPGVVGQGCSFALSPPQLTQLPGGANAVTATLAASACFGVAQPKTSTVCVSTPQGPSNCATTKAWKPAQVFLTVLPLSGTFKATGNGCVRGESPPADFCVPSGPVYATI